MEVTDNGMMQFMSAGCKVHFRAIDRIRLEVVESLDALHAGR